MSDVVCFGDLSGEQSGESRWWINCYLALLIYLGTEHHFSVSGPPSLNTALWHKTWHRHAIIVGDYDWELSISCQSMKSTERLRNKTLFTRQQGIHLTNWAGNLRSHVDWELALSRLFFRQAIGLDEDPDGLVSE